MSTRFFSETGIPQQGRLFLEGTEAHHLANVMRLAIGDEVSLFDGAGLEATARILQHGKKRVELEILETTLIPPAPFELVLASAVPKGDRFRFLIEKATELGVDEFIPLLSERSVTDPRETRIDKMRQVVIEACKQSGRSRLMKLNSPLSLPGLLEQEVPRSQLVLADRAGCAASVLFGHGIIAAASGGREPPVSTNTLAEPVAPNLSRRIVGLVGPEGGFSPKELDTLDQHGAYRVCLADHILRIETAGIGLAVLIRPFGQNGEGGA